jgi:hypothetical protein
MKPEEFIGTEMGVVEGLANVEYAWARVARPLEEMAE